MTTPVVLITGALTGIGRATALAFAQQGSRIVISGRHEKEGQKLVGELGKLGAEAEFVGQHANQSRSRRAGMRRLLWILSGLLLVAGSLLPSSAQQRTPASSATLFVGARLITDGDRPPIENSAFLVQNDRIVQIGTRNDIQAPATRGKPSIS